MLGEVIAIGDELTTGQRLDTNTQWLSERLTVLGVHVVFHTTVADDLEANLQVFRAAIERADFVVATGGLGPTADDLTRDVLAVTLGVELVQDNEALSQIQQMFELRGRNMPESNKLQAFFPKGSQQISNPNGTAPGIHISIQREGRGACQLFALPGVPAELKPMWNEAVAPAIQASMPNLRTIRHRRIKCFGAGESRMEEMLGEMISRGREPLVGITASGATITLRITASGKDEAECMTAMEPTIAEIYQKLGLLVFGEEEDELENAVVRLLVEQGKTIVTSESDTAGLLAQMVRSADNGGKCFRLGFVLSDREQAESVLQAAEQAAAKARRNTGADYGLAISPVKDTSEDSAQVGVALSNPDGVKSKDICVFGTGDFAKLRTAKVALNFLRLDLLRNI